MFDNKVLRYMAYGTSIGSSFVVPVVLGIFAGRFFDQKYGTGQWFSLAGVLLGLILGVTSVVQIIRFMERSENK